MKVLGYEQAKFSFQDGRIVTGMYLYLSETDATRLKNVTGMKTERVFLSTEKLERCSFSPKVGEDVSIYYNRYGKVDSVVRAS